MIFLRSLASAFLMYSRIPMPGVEWKEENRRYSLCFFPLIGAVIGALLLLWQRVCHAAGIGSAVNAAVCVLIPVIVTGGIHIDGFCDTTDAISSYSDRQKRLEIMKDPHIGSFAVIGLCGMFILQFGLFCEIKNCFAAAVGYVLSRSLSGLAAVTFRSAKSGGALQNFVKPAHKAVTVSVLAVIVLLCAAAVIFLSGAPNIGVIVCAAAALSFVFYRFFSYRNFGGITGDTEGWFLQITETAILAAVYIAERLEVLTALLW